MKKVGSLLDRFKNLRAPERSVVQAVIGAISEILNVRIEKESIKISNESILYLSPPSAIKSAIFENKLDVISRINSILGRDHVVEIR